MFGSVMLADIVSYRPLLTGLSHEERDAMAWVSQNTDPSSRFLIVSGTRGGDRSFEWFPALTGRVNASPIEGYEWVPGFAQRVQDDLELQACAVQGIQCLDAWGQDTGVSFTHIYMPKRPIAPLFSPGVDPLQEDCCWSLRAALEASPEYELLYDGPGASIFLRQE
jgi:hypothetical protein